MGHVDSLPDDVPLVLTVSEVGLSQLVIGARPPVLFGYHNALPAVCHLPLSTSVG